MEVSSPDSTSSMQSDNRTDREDRAEETLWTVLGRLYRWKWFIAGVTAVVAVAAVVISLMLPDYYRASTRVLPPANTGGTSMLGSLSEGLPSAAQSLWAVRRENTRACSPCWTAARCTRVLSSALIW
jgi:hypothetical protein